MPANPGNAAPLIIFAFVAWRVAVRLKRSFGRQRLKPKRMIFRICIYSALVLLLGYVAVAVRPNTNTLLSLIGGLVPGAGLGLYGLHLTRFETTTEGRFYTPNPYMGLGLTVILVGRLLYRYVRVFGVADPSQGQPQWMQSALTYFLFGLLAGYYIAYFGGLLAKSRQMPSAPAV
jgi:hypothetical protein